MTFLFNVGLHSRVFLTRSICPIKQSLKEEKLQLMNWSFIPFKGTCIPFPPNDPHKTMRDHSPKHFSSDSIKLAWSTCYKFHNTMSTWPNEPQILYTPYSTTLELLGNVGLSGQWSPHSSCMCNTNPTQPLLFPSLNYRCLIFSTMPLSK